MGFELRDHTADIEIVGHGETVGGAFAGVANGMAAAMCEDWPETGRHHSVSVSAESLDALLFDYMDELIYLRDVRNVLPVDNTASVTRRDDTWDLSGSFRGVPVEEINAREIKAPTYADMEIVETTDQWEARVVLDV